MEPQTSTLNLPRPRFPSPRNGDNTVSNLRSAINHRPRPGKPGSAKKLEGPRDGVRERATREEDPWG